MKISPEVIAELINIFVMAIEHQQDVSDSMRSLDLREDPETGTIRFTDAWLRENR